MSRATHRLGVVGWPVSHSRSPLIHNHWIAAHGLDATYETLPTPAEALPGLAKRLRSGALKGVNVTVPHKEAALAFSDAPEPPAKRLGGANTLWAENGRLRAASTDGAGFLAGLGSTPSRAIVLGAGGAARAIVAALRDAGAEVTLANRTLARAETLAEEFGAAALPWDGLSEAGAADLLVNTTSLGMTGQPPLRLPDGVWDGLSPSARVADIVYAPLETALLTEAGRRGFAPVDGLGMLLHQAALSFEIWFGVRPAVTAELRALVEADLTA